MSTNDPFKKEESSQPSGLFGTSGGTSVSLFNNPPVSTNDPFKKEESSQPSGLFGKSGGTSPGNNVANMLAQKTQTAHPLGIKEKTESHIKIE